MFIEDTDCYHLGESEIHFSKNKLCQSCICKSKITNSSVCFASIVIYTWYYITTSVTVHPHTAFPIVMEQAKKMELGAWAKRRHKTITAHTKMLCHHFHHYMQQCQSSTWGGGRQICGVHILSIVKFPHSNEEARTQLCSDI